MKFLAVVFLAAVGAAVAVLGSVELPSEADDSCVVASLELSS